jgi:hypothetical protein
LKDNIMNKNLRELIKKLATHGYKVTAINLKSKHVKLYINNSKWLIVSKTPKHKGFYKKSLSYLRRERV